MVCTMDTESDANWIPMAEALIAWSDAALINEIRAAEAEIPEGMIGAAGWYTADALPRERRVPVRSRAIGQPKVVRTILVPLWEQVFAQLRTRIEKREITLRGATKLAANEKREVLPSAMAASYEFDPPSNSIFLPTKSFYGVEATRGLGVHPDAVHRQLNAADLSDDEILALLNEHADRVVASPEPKMMARIKDVLHPLIFRRLQWRAEKMLLASTLAEEARLLTWWIHEVAPWHPTPSAKTVENNIRNEYRRLKT